MINKTKEKTNRVFLCFAFGTFAMLLIVIGLVLMFTKTTRDRIEEQNQQYLSDAASQSVKRIDEVFDNARMSIAMVARLYELQMDSPNFDYRLLNDMSKPTPFDFVRFVTNDGISWTGDGEQMDTSNRPYYQEGIQGHSGVGYVSKSRFTNGPILVFYAPLYFQKEIVGVVNGIIEADHLSGEISSTFFKHPSNTYIALSDGTIAVRSQNSNKTSDTLQEVLFTDNKVTEATKAEVEQAINENSELNFRYIQDDGVGNAYISPLQGGEFLLVQTFPANITKSLTERANREGLKLEAAMFFVVLSYLVLMALYYIRRNKGLVKEKEDLSQIVDSVKLLYKRFVIFDLAEDSYEYLRQGNISALGLPGTGRYSEWLEAFREEYEKNPKHWGSMEDMEVEHLRKVLTKENWYAHRDYSTPDGHWERLSLIKLDMDTDVTDRILGAVEDITEIKARDEERRQALETAFHTADEASRAKSDFLSRMSHDIRTPMNAIVGLTAIMAAHLDERERVVDCLTKITSSSKHLLSLINEVLDMSKIESGKLVLSEGEFSLSSVLDDLLVIVQPMMKAKNQKLAVQIKHLEHEDVIGDSTRLQQVYTNILTNAVKYTNEGGNITISLSELPSKTPMLAEYEFVVEDDGIGMTPEFLERIYKPFERAEDDRISKIQGTGLGMAIAQSIVHLMGGTISVESELGKGSRFSVRIFLKLQEKNTEMMVEQLVGLPVLVADDDEVACETTCLLLGELGMESEWVLTGQEAVERVSVRHDEKDDFFAVILDWQMPGMDGVETAKAIRQKVGPDVPIIILSAYDWSDIEEEARAAGVDAFIGKPLYKSRLKGVFVNLKTGAAQNGADSLAAFQERDYKGHHVLLVEDNELNQEIAKEILEMTGLEVETANNGQEAVDMFEHSAPGYYKMILMDIQMPVMNGYEATKAIRALDREDSKAVPIIAMTANTFAEDVQSAMEAGMNQHLGKPLETDQLIATLDKWLAE